MSDLKILRSDLTFEQALTAIESGNLIRRKGFPRLYTAYANGLGELCDFIIRDPIFTLGDYRATDWQEIEAAKEYDELYFG